MNYNYTNLALLVLRVGLSAMLLTHGIPKIERLFAETISFPDPLGVGATLSLILVLIGEVVAPILVMVGYKAKLASIPPMITMLIIVFMIQFNDPFAKQEKALLFLLGFLVVFLAGAGKYSIDRK